MTSAYTTVVIDNYAGWCGVFFGEGLAYKVLNPNQVFYEDLYNGQMEGVSKQGKYLREEVRQKEHENGRRIRRINFLGS